VAAAIAVGSYASASFAGHHFYTADPGEARLVQTQGHVPEGQLGCVYLPDKGPAEAVKFYRLYDPNNGDHLYTVPIYRLYHAGQQDHFMTISAAESFQAVQKFQYKYEGISGWILTQCTRGTTMPLRRFWKP